MTPAALRRVRRALWAALGLVLALGSLLASTCARAQVPVIEPGREDEVLALFSPYTLGADVDPGIPLAGVAIESDSIIATVGPPSDQARLVLLHPRAPNAPPRRSLSFALRIEGSGAARDAAEKLAQAIGQNDLTPFWRVVARTSATAPTEGLGQTLDGLSLHVASLLWLLALLWLSLRPARVTGKPQRDCSARNTALVLLGTTLLALALRLWLSPNTLLGAWSFTRQPFLQQSLFDGPGLAWWSRVTGASFSRGAVVATETLCFSVAAPAAAFVLSSQLTGRRRDALLAALVVAILPLHIRFARSEVSLVASVFLAALFLAQVRLAVRARTSMGATVALAACLAFAPIAFSTRPLDLMLAPLAVAALIGLPSYRGPRHRRVVLGVGVGLVALLVLVDHVMTDFGGQLHGGLDSRVLVDALQSVFSAHDTLLNASITPPALPALALLGLLFLAGHRPRLAIGLAGWLGAAYAAHAYVMPESVSMQARYHVHLVLPFALLVAAGCVAVFRRFPRAAWALLPLLLISPALARGFVTDVAFDPQQEVEFVHRAARQIPDGATVLELSDGHGPRFGRLFDQLVAGTRGPRFHVVTIDPANDQEPFSADARAAIDSGEPLYIYEGIPCLGLPNEPPPTACAALLRTAHVETLLESRTPHRVYDENLAPNLGLDDMLVLRLYRVAGATSAR